MTNKATPSQGDNYLDPFAKQVELALEHFHDVYWLVENSPLAAPYVLGNLFDSAKGKSDLLTGGHVLKGLLQEATSKLAPDLQETIHDRYLKRNPYLNSDGLALKEQKARRTFFRHRLKAVQQVAEYLYRHLLPAIRLESPLKQTIIGRQQIMKACLSELLSGQSVYLYGASGVGKTTLAIALSKAWQESSRATRDPSQPTKKQDDIFWYTLRSDLNDNFQSIVFALGYAMHQQGGSLTWRQLLADKGNVSLERIMGLIRYDFYQLRNSPLLVCIDDVDILNIDTEKHSQVLHLLEELKQLTPLLLIGQRVIMETQRQQVIPGFNETEIKTWLTNKSLEFLSPQQRERLSTLTGGNAAMLTLFASLFRLDDNITAVLDSFFQAPSLGALFNRIWRRLTDEEKSLLMQLAVFPNPAPFDAFSQHQNIYQTLSSKGLLIGSQNGQISLSAHIHSFVYDHIDVDTKFDLHLQAALIFLTRADYTNSLYHYVQANRFESAVRVWFTNRSIEIERGHGVVALEILREIPLAGLANQEDHNLLRIARAELFRLAGSFDNAEVELQNAYHSSKGQVNAYIKELLGDIYERQNRVEQSLQEYHKSIETLLGFQAQRESMLYQKMSYLHLARIPNLDLAEKEARIARLKAEAFHGNVLELMGKVSEANSRYVSAEELILAGVEDLNAQAMFYSYFGKFLLKRGDLHKGLQYLHKSSQIARQRGDTIHFLYDSVNLCHCYTQGGQLRDAIHLAEEGLNLAKKMNHTYLIAGLSAAAADAYYQDGKVNLSEDLIYESLQQEDEFFRPWALSILGMIRSQQGKLQEAIQFLKEASELSSISDKYGEADAEYKLGLVLLNANQIDLAKTALTKAFSIFTDLEMIKLSTEVHTLLKTIG